MIDIDDPDTWPPDIATWATAAAERLRGSTVCTADLDAPGGLQPLLSGHKVLAFHCTRLLDFEVDVLREQGLRPLTPELVGERIERAHAHGALSDASCEAMNVFAVRNQAFRENRVFLVLGRTAHFDEDPFGVEPLLSAWGGEAIRGSAQDFYTLAIGRPSIVVVQIEAGRFSTTRPTLAALLVATILGMDDRGTDVTLCRGVPPEDIIAVWQPGNPEYDRHTTLPRE